MSTLTMTTNERSAQVPGRNAQVPGRLREAYVGVGHSPHGEA